MASFEPLKRSMKNSSPIGIFDSGVGGISVLRWLRQQLPSEHLLYIADSGNAPYGDRSGEFIEKRSISLARFLLEQGAKAIVVACNTATAVAISTLRAEFSIPIIGVEPGVKPALTETKTGIIGILATTETLKSKKFNDLVERLCESSRVVTQGCPGLVERIEERDFSGKKTHDLLAGYLKPVLARGADTIVLGCTHYTFIAPLIRDIVGEEIVIIDTGEAVAREVGRRLREASLLSPNGEPGRELFWTSGKLETTRELIWRLWKEDAEVRVLI